MKNVLKHLMIVTLIVLVMTSCKQNASPSASYQKEMISTDYVNIFAKYKSYNEKNINNYYYHLLDGNSVIKSLNKVNYPDFLSISTKEKAINLDGILLVNKKFFLASDFVPVNLVSIDDVPHIVRPFENMTLQEEAYIAYTEMVKSAEALGIELIVFSAYRSYSKQHSLWLNKDYDYQNNYLAVPGHSEHQTGLSIDIGTKYTGLTEYFKYTASYQFLINNAHNFGFILRYPAGKEAITGYAFEPWHFRYVGDIAEAIYQSGLTLEEYIYDNLEIIT